MALWFGKKDKKLPEVSAPVAKPEPTPPKIQTPPVAGTFPPVKPPQPTGLMPATPIPAGSAMTQPMSMPRTGSTGMKAPRLTPSQTARSTQRIVLPTPPGTRPNSTKPLTMGMPGGRINLPIGMILRCLPPEVLADELSKFEANGTAATEIGLPMNMILGQLPSGKVEMALQDLIPHFPAGYLQPTESITNYLPTVVSLPLMDVVMRIPPDLLALRPDQKDVDASVINMADPFTEEILREQAETSRKQSQTNIIDESQAPQEEFVPRDQIVSRDQIKSSQPIAPARRTSAEPMAHTRPTTTFTAPPMPMATKLPTPQPMSSLRGSPSVPPSIPPPSARSISPSGQIPAPTRATTSLPIRPPVPVAETPPPTLPSAPVPPVPRHTGAIPAPPPPRHTTSLPVPRRTGAIPPVSQTSGPAPQVLSSAAKPSATPVAASAPNAGADDLQRLAALAMAQMGESSETAEAPAQIPPKQEPIRAPAPEPIRAPEPKVEEPAPAIASAPVPAPDLPPVAKPEPMVLPKAAPEPAPSIAAAQPPAAPEPEAHAAVSPTSVAFNLNTCTAEDLVQNIHDCSPELAESIIRHRRKIGSFNKLEELLDVPGITKAAYTNLTGEAAPDNRMPLTLNELLGFSAQQHVTLKDVTDRITCWPDVTGCLLSQRSGLPLVGTAPEGVNKEAVVAFAPRMFEAINKSFSEVSGKDTDALVIPSFGTSFHLIHNGDLYLIIMSRLPLMPERHLKVARFVLAALSVRKD